MERVLNYLNSSNKSGRCCSEAFFDPPLVVIDASRNDEARDAAIGLDRRWNLLYVIFIEREDDMIRIIISVRSVFSKIVSQSFISWQLE